MIDLGRWVNEEYRVPGKPIPLKQPDADAPTTSPEDD
jgi:endogenous inhibitor of DNA gyrase (YacG/DUF329 family)